MTFGGRIGPSRDARAADCDTHCTGTSTIDPVDRALLIATQAGLPRVSAPYAAIGARIGLDEAEVLARLRRMIDRGVIRRIGLATNHYALGWIANGMTVWDIADERAHAIGCRIGGLPEVSHCYLRPRRPPAWRYNLFAMLHGRSREAVLERAQAIADTLGDACLARDVLFSTRILKKTGVRLAASPDGRHPRPEATERRP